MLVITWGTKSLLGGTLIIPFTAIQEFLELSLAKSLFLLELL